VKQIPDLPQLLQVVLQAGHKGGVLGEWQHEFELSLDLSSPHLRIVETEFELVSYLVE
jgi:hypothetical protein